MVYDHNDEEDDMPLYDQPTRPMLWAFFIAYWGGIAVRYAIIIATGLMIGFLLHDEFVKFGLMQ